MEELKVTEDLTNAIVKTDDISPTFVMTLDEAKTRMTELANFVQSQMRPEEDYGIIPGTKKPTLYQAGAEKLALIFGLTPQFDIIDAVNDWEKGFFRYQLKCKLVSKRNGQIVAEGLGSCNTKENRYIRQDPYTLDNTILKMAKKRAFVDAVKIATRTSNFFTQDLEDLIDVPTVKSYQPKVEEKTEPVVISGEVTVEEFEVTEQPKEQPKIQQKQSATQKQLKALEGCARYMKKTLPELLKQYGFDTAGALSIQDASYILGKILNKK